MKEDKLILKEKAKRLKAEKRQKRLEAKSEKLLSKTGKLPSAENLQKKLREVKLMLAGYADDLMRLQQKKQSCFDKIDAGSQSVLDRQEFSEACAAIQFKNKSVQILVDELNALNLALGLTEEINVGNFLKEHGIDTEDLQRMSISADQMESSKFEKSETAKEIAEKYHMESNFPQEKELLLGAFDDPEFLKMKQEKSDRQAEPAKSQVSMESVVQNIDAVLSRLRGLKCSYSDKAEGLSRQYEEVCAQLKELLTKRKELTAAECEQIDGEIDSLGVESRSLKRRLDVYRREIGKIDLKLATAESLKQSSKIEAGSQFKVDGVLTDFDRITDELAVYLNDAASKGNEEMQNLKTAFDVAHGTEIDKNAYEGISIASPEEILEDKNEDKYADYERMLGLR